jgi:hypothetical protein
MSALVKRLLIKLLALLSKLRPQPHGTRLDISDLVDFQSRRKNENNDIS